MAEVAKTLGNPVYEGQRAVTVTSTTGLTDTELRASPVPVNVTFPATIAVTQSGAWSMGQSETWTVNSAQSGTWNINAVQSGAWTVSLTGTAAVTQSGDWTITVEDFESLLNVNRSILRELQKLNAIMATTTAVVIPDGDVSGLSLN